MTEFAPDRISAASGTEFAPDRISAASGTEFAPDRISAASGRLQFETWAKGAGLLLLFVSFLVMMSAGCSDGQVPEDSTPQDATPLAGDGQASPVIFPQHDAPLGTDGGGDYFAGQLVLIDGCLRVEVRSNDTDNPRPSSVLIWPRQFTLEGEAENVRIVDGLGRTAARVGDYIRLSRADVTHQQATDLASELGLPDDCPRPSFLVGDEVTVFDPKNEATELRLADPDVLFLRQKTVIWVNRVFPLASGVGELVLDGPCLRLNGGATISWPAGFTPHVEDGVVHVRNGAGQTIAKVGDEIAGGGGYHNSRYGECTGSVFEIHGIKVLPDVEVYFPKQDGTLANGRIAKRHVGALVVNHKCLEIRLIGGSGVPDTVLPLWPSTFELNVEDGEVAIVDAGGRVIARVGDEVQFDAFNVSFSQATEHGGLEELTPACSGPYWVVAEEFGVIKTP